jgi:outer membrane lipoprotein SlyB
VNRVVRGTVISARQVNIQGNRSGIGAGAGAAGGAVGGSAIGGDRRSNILGAIGGAVVGGIVGAAVEEGSTAQNGMEYVIQAENGALLTVVQGTEPVIKDGERVLVLYGSQSRVILDTSTPR